MFLLKYNRRKCVGIEYEGTVHSVLSLEIIFLDCSMFAKFLHSESSHSLTSSGVDKLPLSVNI